MTKITILGQGAMGSRMADRLEAAGHCVTRWNRTGAAQSPRDAVAGAEVVIAMLRDDPASQSAWLDSETGALAGLAPDAMAIESSTLTQGFMQELGQRSAARGIAFLDAPVLGSRPQAEAGQLIHLVGGDSAVLERVQPVLGALGAKQLHVGAVGAGTAMKLIANTLFGVQVALVAELLGRMRALGLDPARGIELLAQTPQLSPAAQGAARLMLAGKDAAMFPVDLVAKDFCYAIGSEAAAMPLAEAARGVFLRASASGLGGDNLTGVRKLYTPEDGQ
jgi:3-hydroxyisobutyrate dehydrogenase-like beta-hydroxyacid dehydrogenase